MTGVLVGLGVLDFGRFIVARWCSAILGNMGPDAIRVDQREGGEVRWVQRAVAAMVQWPHSCCGDDRTGRRTRCFKH